LNASNTLDNQYFEWLYKNIGSIRNSNPFRSYWHLARVLYTTPYFWFVHNDDNRVEDGRALRDEFLSEYPLGNVELEWMGLDCSMLEMLIGLARRAEFQSDTSAGDWFWKFMQNLEIRDYTDAVWNPHIEQEVNEALERVCRRTYAQDGTGGLFPLRRPERDQRRIELAYQLSAYLLESEYVDRS
jgi:hypothetical protein